MTVKICRKCGLNPRPVAPFGKQTQPRWCLKCHAAYMREYRKKHPVTIATMTPEQRLKYNARHAAIMRTKRKKLTKKPCEVCGNKAQMHHPDHSKPFEIVFLCHFHHQELHYKQKQNL